ncbi:MAG: phosphonate metabolism protein/1,5-bisphosphokinase (PRPP-forming) PhnN [Paracoccaceae bacterium]|nr:phosphonate metabolism protein/1,5-bisphosphokinase (PRPP-forming) PhnN [Paracoccaceae bacterium]
MGRLFAVVGPSGAGKDTLMAAACLQRPDLHMLRRVITRPEAAGGEDFEGVSEAEFLRRKAAGEFALDWQAHGLRYGVALPAGGTRGGDVMFNCSRAVLPRAQAMFPALVVVLVTAPAPVLAARLAARGREAPVDIEARLTRAGFALPEVRDLRRVENDATPTLGVARFLAAVQPDRG